MFYVLYFIVWNLFFLKIILQRRSLLAFCYSPPPIIKNEKTFRGKTSQSSLFNREERKFDGLVNSKYAKKRCHLDNGVFSKSFFRSNIFVREKLSGYKPVLNLKKLNQDSNCINETFKLSVDHSSGQHFSNGKHIRGNGATYRSSLRESVRIRNFSIPYFPAFGLTTERYSISLHI